MSYTTPKYPPKEEKENPPKYFWNGEEVSQDEWYRRHREGYSTSEQREPQTTNEPEFVCEYCGKECSSQGGLSRHKNKCPQKPTS